MPVAKRQSLVADALARCPRRSIQAQRLKRFMAFPFLGTSMFRMLREGAMHSRCDRVVLLVKPAFANAAKKTPPGGEPEGVRVASGSRGDRPPMCRRSAEWDAFVTQPGRECAQTAALGLQCVALGDVGDEVHGQWLIEMVVVQRRSRTLRARKNECKTVRPGMNGARSVVNATAVPVASTRDRATSAARSRRDAGCRPGMHCGRARSVRAGTAAARRRAASQARRSCR